MRVVAFDTSERRCSVAVFDGEQLLAAANAALSSPGFGPAEALLPMLTGVLAQAQVAFGDLQAVVVGAGPGSFTGIRAGVAAARALGLALHIPVHAVSSSRLLALAALAHPAAAEQIAALGAHGLLGVALDAGREGIYFELLSSRGETISGPELTTHDKALKKLARLLLVPTDVATPPALLLLGSAAAALTLAVSALGLPIEALAAPIEMDVRALGPILHALLAQAPVASPLYLRDADAKPNQPFVLNPSSPGPLQIAE